MHAGLVRARPGVNALNRCSDKCDARPGLQIGPEQCHAEVEGAPARTSARHCISSRSLTIRDSVLAVRSRCNPRACQSICSGSRMAIPALGRRSVPCGRLLRLQRCDTCQMSAAGVSPRVRNVRASRKRAPKRHCFREVPPRSPHARHTALDARAPAYPTTCIARISTRAGQPRAVKCVSNVLTRMTPRSARHRRTAPHFHSLRNSLFRRLASDVGCQPRLSATQHGPCTAPMTARDPLIRNRRHQHAHTARLRHHHASRNVRSEKTRSRRRTAQPCPSLRASG